MAGTKAKVGSDFGSSNSLSKKLIIFLVFALFLILYIRT